MNRRETTMKHFNSMTPKMKERIERDIETHRKGKLVIRVVDKNGKPMQNARIQYTQKSHQFLHGANLFMLDELETAEKNETYKKLFPTAFNQATLPFYWDAIEPEEGKTRYTADSEKVYRRPAPDLCLNYCSQHGITPKAHCLTYFAFNPNWVSKTDVNDMKTKLQKRYKDLSAYFGEKIPCWEVINELLCSYQEPNYSNAFFKEKDVLEWNFNLAQKYFKNNHLLVNEAPWIWHWQHFDFDRSAYYMMIERALAKGARIDSVGMQYHVFSKSWEEDMYNPELIFKVLDTYAQLKLPIQITEVTVPAYSDSKEDEELQADLLENLYTIWFSHPSVEMITYWNVVDGYAAWAPQGDMTKGENVFYGGLISYDMRKKPAFRRLQYLFNQKWHTQGECVCDKNGVATLNGFYGKYNIVANGKTVEVNMNVNGENVVEITLP